jgi:hypothetical protein
MNKELDIEKVKRVISNLRCLLKILENNPEEKSIYLLKHSIKELVNHQKKLEHNINGYNMRNIFDKQK